MDTMPDVPQMSERTLRWPGHVAAVKPLVESGRFLEEFRARCVADPARDLVAMVVRARWKDRSARMTLVSRYDAGEALTAMARTTALTTSVTAQLVARGGGRAPGVHPLERVARDGDAYRFIVDEMARRGVLMRWRDE
jgi:saccharopine dehydrogenase-like NADP-dependent oxidoreductase